MFKWSSHFLCISANLEQLGFFSFLPNFVVPKWGAGIQNKKNHFWPIFSPFCRIWNKFVFFRPQFFRPQLGGGESGNYFWSIFSTFQPIYDNFDLLSTFFLPQLGGGVVKKSGNYFWPIFSPFQPIWGNFDFFHVDQKKIGGRGKKIFLFHISSSWVNCIWHDKFQLRDVAQNYYSCGGVGGWLEKMKIRLTQPSLVKLGL